jgi:Ras-related protein Rab-7A
MNERFCKVLLLGDLGVGKTALCRRITESSFFEEKISTLGADFATKDWAIGDRIVPLHIWDTAGQERFHAICSAFYRGTDACMIVFDLTRRDTFEHVVTWKEGLEQKIGVNRPGDFPLLLLGNKSDLVDRREVDGDEAAQFGKIHGFSYFEVSAKTQDYVGNALDEVARRFVERSKSNVFRSIRPNATAVEAPEDSQKCC